MGAVGFEIEGLYSGMGRLSCVYRSLSASDDISPAKYNDCLPFWFTG